MNLNKGFTLIELLVVVAIVGLLATISMGYLGEARKKGGDTAVKSNLSTVRAQSEIFYLENANSYLPIGGVAVSGTCPVYNVSGTSMLSINKTVADAIAEAIARGNGSSCYNSADAWAVAVGLSVNPSSSWCVDNSGIAKTINSVPSLAINSSSFNCN